MAPKKTRWTRITTATTEATRIPVQLKESGPIRQMTEHKQVAAVSNAGGGDTALLLNVVLPP